MLRSHSWLDGGGVRLSARLEPFLTKILTFFHRNCRLFLLIAKLIAKITFDECNLFFFFKTPTSIRGEYVVYLKHR